MVVLVGEPVPRLRPSANPCRCAICEAKGLTDVHILFDGAIQERGIDVNLTEFEVHDGCNGKEEVEASHPDDRGESLYVVETRVFVATLGHEAGLVARNFTLNVRLDIVHPHDVDDRAICGEMDEFPRVIVREGAVLSLHC
jgi:hypothetical protein